jgi:hypothetical protein
MDALPGRDLDAERFTDEDIDRVLENLVLIRAQADALRRALTGGRADDAALASQLREIDAETERINEIIMRATRFLTDPGG